MGIPAATRQFQQPAISPVATQQFRQQPVQQQFRQPAQPQLVRQPQPLQVGQPQPARQPLPARQPQPVPARQPQPSSQPQFSAEDALGQVQVAAEQYVHDPTGDATLSRFQLFQLRKKQEAEQGKTQS